MQTLADERAERELADAQREPADAISTVIGVRMFANNHRFPGLRAPAWSNTSVTAHGLAVSRFYFAAKPPVAVDIIAQPSRAKNEIAAKRAYCARNNIRYVVVGDAYDDEGVREQLLRSPRSSGDETGATDTAALKARPVTQKRARRKVVQ